MPVAQVRVAAIECAAPMSASDRVAGKPFDGIEPRDLAALLVDRHDQAGREPRFGASESAR